MSLALIEETAKEVRRLAIAGSPLAVGDFRLKKLVPPLEQAGAKVPVFAQVAKAIGDMVNGNETESATRLLTLSTLLNAILYTQGRTGSDGDYQEIDGFTTNCCSTKTSARVLKPLIEALTSSGSGRFEMIKTACERGAFNDMRLIEPAIQGLGDNYPELADLVAGKILPGYGPGIVPLLKARLDLKGKKLDARRLTVMHALDPAGTIAVCKTALEDGSPEVKAAAITCLGKHEDCLPLVLEQANSKNKTLRAAALEALAQHDRPEVTKIFGELIKGKVLDLLVQPFRAIRNRQVVGMLVAEGKRVFDLLAKGGEEHIPRYLEILTCLAQRRDVEVEEFLLTCFAGGEKLAKLKAAKDSHVTGPDLLAHIASLLSRSGSPKALEAVLASRNLLPPAAFGDVVRAALVAWTPAKVYEEFASVLGQNKGAGKEKNLELQRIIRAARAGSTQESDNLEEGVAEPQSFKSVEWDSRWLDAAIKADEPDIVCCLARPGHKNAIAYLLKTAEAKNRFHTGLIIETLARCGYLNLTDLFLDLVTKRTKNAGAFHYELQVLLQSARHLPPSDLPRLDAFAAKLDEKFVDRYLEALEPLRPTTGTN